MSTRVKRLYRVTATFGPTSATRRDYQTKAAAEHHAEVLRATCIEGHFGYPIAPTSVTVTTSDPITWPAS